jgi:hypothetical protein
LTNVEACIFIDFLFLEASIPKWLKLQPLIGRISPGETISIIIEFEKEEVYEKNQNLDGLIALQYTAANIDPPIETITRKRGTDTSAGAHSVFYAVDKLVVPVLYEVYHEV